jgi:hypothetical protein
VIMQTFIMSPLKMVQLTRYLADLVQMFDILLKPKMYLPKISV